MATTKAHLLSELYDNDIQGCFPVLIEVYSPDLVWTEEEKAAYGQEDFYFRLISDCNQVVYKNKTWLPSNFSIPFPETTGQNINNVSLKISALDDRMKELLLLLNSDCKFSIIASYAKINKENAGFYYQFLEMKRIELNLISASANDPEIVFNLAFDNILQQQIPYDEATLNRVPSTNMEE